MRARHAWGRQAGAQRSPCATRLPVWIVIWFGHVTGHGFRREGRGTRSRARSIAPTAKLLPVKLLLPSYQRAGRTKRTRCAGLRPGHAGQRRLPLTGVSSR